ncbi:hydroxyacylglutathione hydrolase [Psychrosphaera sp.]|nr:hydroxyacylglutathione hydrolase [Psychrosphaera sp.]
MYSIVRISAFNDNYLWLLKDKLNQAVIVDPGDAQPVINLLDEQGLELKEILLTHHHADHIGGVETLLKQFPNAKVFGPATERFSMVTHPCVDGDELNLSISSVPFRVISVPGHTIDHIAYYSKPNVFVGDTLFSSGCGRLFEGSPSQMLNSLNRLIELPNDTDVYCAHEYTLANTTFAQHVLPSNEEIKEFRTTVERKRKVNEATVPTTIAVEKKINPFLLCHTNELKESVKKNFQLDTSPSDLEAFTLVRKWKDKF